MSCLLRLSIIACVAAFTIACGLQTAVADNKTLALVVQANKAFDDGDLATARTAVDEALKNDSDKTITARAMLLRAQIQEKDGKLARALSDYSGALWLQTLPTNEKQKATDGKERVMAAMGLNSPLAPSAPSSSSAVATEPAKESPGLFGSLGGLFGGGSREAKEARTPPARSSNWQTATAQADDVAPKSTPVREANVDDDAETKPKRAAKKTKEKVETAAAVKPAAEATPRVEKASTAPSRQDGGDNYFIDFGGAGSATAAKEQAKAIKTKLSDILVNRDLIVQPGSGAYRIVAGPYKAKSAASALCSAMSKRGVSCKVAEG